MFHVCLKISFKYSLIQHILFLLKCLKNKCIWNFPWTFKSILPIRLQFEYNIGQQKEAEINCMSQIL